MEKNKGKDFAGIYFTMQFWHLSFPQTAACTGSKIFASGGNAHADEDRNFVRNRNGWQYAGDSAFLSQMEKSGLLVVSHKVMECRIGAFFIKERKKGYKT